MNIFTDFIRREREYEGIVKTLGDSLASKNPHPMKVTGLCEGALTAFYSSFLHDSHELTGSGALIIVPDEKEVARTANSLTELGLDVLTYPYRDFVFHNITASHDFEHERLSVLCAALSGKFDAVVTTPDAALGYTVPRKRLAAATIRISHDGKCDPAKLAAELTASGYVRSDPVDGKGCFSVRGGIVDVFPPSCENPVRIELWDDEIDRMGYFDVITQRKTADADSVLITPAREIFFDSESREKLCGIVSSMRDKAKDEKKKEIFSLELEDLRNNAEAAFADKYISAVYPEKECLLDYFDSCTVIVKDMNGVLQRARFADKSRAQTVEDLLREGLVPSELADYGRDTEDLLSFIERHPGAICDSFASGASPVKLAGIFDIVSKQTVSYADNFELLCEDLTVYGRTGFTVVMLCENEIMEKNLAAMLRDKGIPAEIVRSDAELTPGHAYICGGKNVAGYELTKTKFALMSLYERKAGTYKAKVTFKKSRRNDKNAGDRIMSYADLRPGDYVVHANHGIGMFEEIRSVTTDGVTRDYVKIKYAGSDVVYLPCDNLDMLSKYIGPGADDGTVKLSRPGGAEWAKAKTRVKAAAKEMAKELIELYARRSRKEGFAFLADDDMQRDFEASFEYDETDGQLEAIDEIKHDMESSVPMDRLLCGDVGFGKTEVAIRAAFKAVRSGKQVAILVPTTILALQHYQTLLSRFRGFPVKTDMLSRFVGEKQKNEILRSVARGETDILVGTHRIVSSDLKFRDLGLVIIDEEQRFGVAQKEKLKQIAGNVDVLTLSATPIPRTLNMAMSGIRDMSVLEEAPADRVPVQTYVLEYDEDVIGEAIRRELRRGGQVFCLYNRIEGIEAEAERIRKLAPDANIATAHGRMDKEELSDIWRAMLDGDIDILVSTTIIESGIDVPNANTLIIDGADKLGLSQLHQIRGRVGRSGRRAYAYFTYRKGMALSEIAEKRLSAIRDYTEFGSGFKVALRDLEIRGAGNLLGAEQHGHIESVGYDLYMKLLNEAILEEKGVAKEKHVECTVDLGVNAFIPESYIKSCSQRIDVYKKISLIGSAEDASDVTDELLDRYGDLPVSADNLIHVSLCRSLGSLCGFTKIERRAGLLTFTPDSFDARAWTLMASRNNGRVLMSVGAAPYASVRIKKGEKPLALAEQMLNEYLQIKRETETKSDVK